MGPLTCWNSKTHKASLVAKSIFYLSLRGIPILVGVLIVIISYRKSISSLADVPTYYFHNQNFSIYQLLWYPALFFITYVPYVIFDIWGLFSDEKRTVMIIILLILSHPVGFYNALLFIIQRKLYKIQTEANDEYGKHPENDAIDEERNCSSKTFVTHLTNKENFASRTSRFGLIKASGISFAKFQNHRTNENYFIKMLKAEIFNSDILMELKIVSNHCLDLLASWATHSNFPRLNRMFNILGSNYEC